MKLSPVVWLAIKRTRQHLAVVVWSLFYRMYLHLHPACLSIGRLRVTGRLKLDLDPFAHFHLGDGVRINSGALVNAIGGHRKTIIALHRGARLAIGRGTGLSSCTIVCKCMIRIGEQVLVGGGTVIVDSDLHALAWKDREQPRDNRARSAPISIGDRVFIGGGAMILKGVSVGADAVIGAGAIITRDVPSAEIWAGNPARCIGRVTDARTTLTAALSRT